MSDSIDFDFLASSGDGEDGGSVATIDSKDEGQTSEPSPGERKRERAKPQAETTKAVEEDDVDEILLPVIDDDDSEPEPETKQKPAAKKEAEADKPIPKQPVIHDPQLLYAASTWGISPDEAQNYHSEEALIATINERERKYQRMAAAKQAEEEAAKNAKPALKVPDIKLDDIEDPQAKAAIASMRDFMAQFQETTETEKKALRDEVVRLKTEAQHAAQRDSRSTQAKIVRAFDEEVASWGEEFAELIGVPSQSMRESGTEKAKAAQRINRHVEMLQRGWVDLEGRLPDADEAVTLTKEFARQARYALWPEMAQKEARKQVSDSLKKQRGGVGLRPTKARSNEPPAQGDDAAKEAVSEFYASIGFDPWGNKKRRSA